MLNKGSSVVWLYASFWCYAGVWLLARRDAWDPSGRNRRGLAVLLLVAVLQRAEPYGMRWEAAEISINKVRGYVLELGDWKLSLDLAGEVAEGRGRWLGLELQGDFLLQVGDHYMVASFCRHDFWLRRQPLQAPSMASVQPPRRPFEGSPMAFIVFPLPSGLVPGEKEGGRRWCPCYGGGEGGLDCFSCLCFRVLCAILQDCFVISVSYGVLFVICTPSTMNILQH